MLQQLRRDAKKIFSAGISAVDPARAVTDALSLSDNSLHCQDLTIPLPAGKIKLIGAGKAATPMAAAAEQLLGAHLETGLVITKEGHGGALSSVELLEAAHPVPDRRGELAAGRLLDIVDQATTEDLVIALISGGGSALLPAPTEPINLADKMAITNLLLRCGASIDEINTVRKHLSKIKGGRLAQRTAPARLLTLIISDVIGDNLDVIASGPTVPDPTTFAQALAVLEKHQLRESCPKPVLDYLLRGQEGMVPETPKPGQLSEFCHTRIIASNKTALQAAQQKAEQLGYTCLSLGSEISGEASDVARKLIRQAGEHAGSMPFCLLAGGETTVTIKGDGRGGRNQELALSAAIALQGTTDTVVLAGGTDGNDGPTDAAGAIIDGLSIERGLKLGKSAQEYLDRNDSYTFHQATDDLLITGPTCTNVMDIDLVLIDRSGSTG